MSLVRDYAFPVALALLLHVGAAALLFHSWQPNDDATRLFEPRAIAARLVVLQGPTRKQPAPKAEPKPAPKSEPSPPPPAPKPAPAKPAQLRIEPDKPDPEAERRAREERERLERLRELSERSTQLALAGELADLRDAESDTETMTYAAAIRQMIVVAWSRPPSARNDMRARLRVDLVPSGDLLSVTVLESSGNAAFDRSAEAAVRRVERFDVPKDRRLFEENFRRFTLLFKPEDLLR